MAFRVAEDLRGWGIDVVMHCGGGSFKSQMKKADASGAGAALLIGEDEAAAGEVTLKPLRGGEQRRVPVGRLADEMMEEILQVDGDDGGV